MDSLLTTVADYLVRQSWQILAVFVLVAAACWVLRKASAHWRYLLWLVVLAKCLAPGLVSVPLAVLPQQAQVPQIASRQTPPVASPAPVATPAPANVAANGSEMANENGAPTVAMERPIQQEVATPSITYAANTMPTTALTLRAWLALAWLAGVGLFLAYVLIRAWTMHRRLRRTRRMADREIQSMNSALAKRFGLKMIPTVYMVDGIAQPFVWGWLRGSIYLPEQFVGTGTHEQRQAILTHELAHVARWDAAANLVQIIAQAVFFFHPLIWWTNRQIRREREKCCDEIVIAGLRTDPRQYSQAIVNALVAEYEANQPIPSLAVAGRLKNIEERIQTILRPDGKFCRRPSWAAVATVLLLAACAVPTALVLTDRADSGESPNGQIQTEKPGWLDGSGKDLRIKIAGSVLDENGAPAKDFKLEAGLRSRFDAREDLPATMKGNRFEFWVPVGRLDWFAVHVRATSADGRQIARQQLMPDGLRQAAIDGLTVRMTKPERFVEVTVTKDEKTVPGAHVAAEFGGERLTSNTNDAGIATFAAMNRDKLSQLTAWTDDFMVGGYSFYGEPPRDGLGSKFSIELDKCRDQTIRIINAEDKKPVADLAFLLTVGTGEPNQYPGRTPDCQMKTDANGEAVFLRFPDWKKHRSYVEILDPHWVKADKEATVDGVIVVPVRKSRYDDRKRVAGTVTSADGNVAGFAVTVDSFQGEEKHNSDVLLAFTDEHGKFSADCLPGATYCFCISDAQFVSDTVDSIPYEPVTDKMNVPSLSISPGSPVEVVVTAGAEKRPVAYQHINLSTPHEFSWREDGQQQGGISGRRWSVTTDEYGKARTVALAGKEIKGSLYTPEWQAEESVQVKADGVTTLEFHQKIAAKRKVTGRLCPAENAATDLNEAIVKVIAIDGETHEDLTVKTDAVGKFAFESQSSRIGIYAHTKDAKAAVVTVADRLDEPMEIRLKPTSDFHGQLLGKEETPLRDHAVHVVLTVVGRLVHAKSFPTNYLFTTFESKTDSNGNYSFMGLPCETALSLETKSIDGSDQDKYLGKFYLVPNESRPLMISRLWKPEAQYSFAERYQRLLRDCRLSGFRAMVILFQPSDDAKQFVEKEMMDYQKTIDVASFMQLQGQVDDAAANAEVVEFAKAKKWLMPRKGMVFACALDGTGNELGRIELDAKSQDSPRLAAEFIRQHAAEPADAQKKWDEAFSTAKQTGRKVWARTSQRYCGPCFKLTRWLDDHKEVLDQDYVFLKVDDWRDLHGGEVAHRLTDGQNFGIPFFAIFDADGRRLITSESPIGNTGFPDGFDETRHMRKMLTETRGKITTEQIDRLIDSLND